MNTRQLFQRHLAQTSPSPVGLHITAAHGNYLYDIDGKAYLDMIGGISVCNLGHGRMEVLKAIKKQADDYLHIMVYGELIQSPQVAYAQLLKDNLPSGLDCVYFTNSGAEATEGAIKLARRSTGRTDIIAANYSYHGNTTGALSLMGDEYWRNSFRPLMPGVWHFDFNSEDLIENINTQTACVVLETVQAEAGVVLPHNDWLRRVKEKCQETGALLVLDEIQCGFGRTGTLWGFDHYEVVPDILLLGKALGGGMPLGAFVAPFEIMQCLTENPVLGHLTTFGGHPVSCAAGLAALEVLLKQNIVEKVSEKEKLFHKLLRHPAIRSVRSKGLLIAVEMENDQAVMNALQLCLEKGLFADWFLFAPHCIRFAPPLTINKKQIEEACSILLSCL